jgi:hypothetical protein
VPRRPPHVWKDPDIILKEYDVSHCLNMSSYISMFRSLFGNFSLITPSPRAAPATASPAWRRAGHDREGSGTATSTRSFAIIEKLVDLGNAVVPEGCER